MTREIQFSKRADDFIEEHNARNKIEDLTRKFVRKQRNSHT